MYINSNFNTNNNAHIDSPAFTKANTNFAEMFNENLLTNNSSIEEPAGKKFSFDDIETGKLYKLNAVKEGSCFNKHIIGNLDNLIV
ncbi:MAG TPA: hypothetical protein DF296_09750 [Candidatus Margulisbacteria bacterium]|nr:MAG: hypothetical protein A2X43_08030 [Candidatus Margulisbacteria bacterium GWD2_39_127]OGI05667.1 MAG: hypothetical protein A2X41_03560 [Candidatus Margulisbacteria bacterium GWE2_39_32]HAR63738.1 hypothetical protein [Candidatus Margulisiibacteriota bacterium]HCT85470.1 hypothetical protein [Candidatus Margulisiibacteriota bacterium]